VLQLVELGHTVHLIDFRRSALGETYLRLEDKWQEVDIADLDKRVASVNLIDSPTRTTWRYIASVPYLRRILLRCRPDLLLTLYGGGLGLMAFLSGFRPYAVYVVGSDVLFATGLRRRITSKLLNTAGIVFANGGHLAEKTREIATRASVVPLLLGVDLDRWTPGVCELGTVGIVCTRGFISVYNNALLIEAAALLPTSLPDFSITFTSGGPLLGEVRKQAKHLLPPRIYDRVRFLGGIPDEDLQQLLQQSSIYVSLSRSDGTSASLLEALACGLYPVLSDIPANREWIDSSAGNGTLVPLAEPEVLARVLVEVILDHEGRKNASLHNRRIIEQRANSRKNMQCMIDHLRALIAQSKDCLDTHVN
jgi:glycosyltransferase involved in cell wall biosynthesis